jgi:hypothetical protein
MGDEVTRLADWLEHAVEKPDNPVTINGSCLICVHCIQNMALQSSGKRSLHHDWT